MTENEKVVRRYQYAVGKLSSVLTGDFENCLLTTFSQKKAKEFISGLPLLSFLNIPYVTAVMGAYSIDLTTEDFERRPELMRVLYPDTYVRGKLNSREIQDNSDEIFRYRFVTPTKDEINPSLVTLVFNPDVPTGLSIEELAIYRFGFEAVQRIEIRPYKRINLQVQN